MKEKTKPKAYQLCDDLHEMNKSCLLTKEQHDTIFASSLAIERLYLLEIAFEDYINHSQRIQDAAKERIEDLTKELQEVKKELAKSQAEANDLRNWAEEAQRTMDMMTSF